MLDFDAFFEAVHGHEPFPWQRRIAARAASGLWPEALALPTGSGKTACIDIAVFALAAQADRRASERTAPRRVFFVIDRRVVVEQAYRATSRLAVKLADAHVGIIGEVADRLRSLSEGDEPLVCFELRGGIYRDDAWARTPTQPTVIVSTVDQIGSRVLYRGYGTSRWIRPIHAGLSANDALIFLDEAHCSNPFRESLRAIGRFRSWATNPIPNPFQVVLLSATPPPGVTAERAQKEDLQHPVLGPRLAARKLARLNIAKLTRGTDPLETLSEELAQGALELRKNVGHGLIAVVANRVRTAKLVHARLRELAPEADHLLLTGRMRPYDRDLLMEQWEPLLRATAIREERTRPLFLAATQCIEVGADFDFDALVSECASLDALRQRFGRLNRLGRHRSAPATILIRADQAKESDEDPVYGSALSATFSFLKDLSEDGTTDMGVSALGHHVEALEPERLEALLPLACHAPTMLPAHLDAWVQTDPEPVPSPEPALFLHGTDPTLPEVSVVFRSDLSVDEVQEDVWIDAVSLLPPTGAEAFPVPVPALRRWLAKEIAVVEELSDVDGTRDSLITKLPVVGIPFLRWSGPESSELCRAPTEARPGDTIVLPASTASTFQLGSFPEGTLVDVAEPALLASKRRAVLRLQPAVLTTWPPDWPLEEFRALAASEDETEVQEALDDALEAVGTDPRATEWLQMLVRELRGDPRRRLVAHPMGGWVVVGFRDLGRDFTTEDATSCATNAVRLERHSASVRDQARAFARSCGLPPALVEDVALAGWLHDFGKSDPRFQLWLHGGDLLRAAASPGLLAKSARFPRSALAVRRARERSGYPSGGRHELLSVRLAESDPALLEKTADRELVLHLVESHHGRCRPFAPIVRDPDPIDVELETEGVRLSANSCTHLECLDQGVPDRFWSLARRYGWWGIAYLEAILRLADHRVSEREASGES